MKLFPPSANITLYEDGFKGKDLLDRSIEAKKLSELIEKIEDPTVIALDGDWGIGKTHFLKCWVGAHRNEFSGSALTLYFDAFESDFLNDPLIALTNALDQRLHDLGINSTAWQRARNAATVLARVSLQAGVRVATAGVVQNTDDLFDPAIETIGGELGDVVNSFWKQERSKIKAMARFKDALKEASQNGDVQKIVIVVDELDRCRPDYALSLLEVAKHFFAVKGVHFVLGVNLDELENSVRARYGQGVDARRYLQKFVTFTLKLSEEILLDGRECAASLTYFDKMALEMELPQQTVKFSKDILSELRNETTLRDIQKVLTALALLPNVENKERGYFIMIVSLLLVRQFDPKLFFSIKRQEAKLVDICKFLGKSLPGADDQPDNWKFNILQTIMVWSEVLGEDLPDQFTAEFSGRAFGVGGPRQGLTKALIRDYLEVFQLQSDEE